MKRIKNLPTDRSEPLSDRQLIFDLEPRPAFQAEDFFVAECNKSAVEWMDQFPNWPAPALILTGAAASGKSHLTSVFLAAQNAKTGSLQDQLPSNESFGPHQALVFEDLDQNLHHASDQENLFHLFNHARESHRFLLLTARIPPSRWSLTLNDLASRLKACPIAEIATPDDQLLGALIVKHFADRQLRVEPDVIDYAIARIERSFTAARAFVVACDKMSLARKRAVTVPLARQILSEQMA